MSNASANAIRLLKAKGEAVQVTFPSAPSFDPVTGDTIAGGVPVVLAGYGYSGQYKSGDVDGTVIKSGDVRLVLGVLSDRPVVGSSVLVDGVTYRAMSVSPIRESGRDVLYIVQLRAGQ